MKNVYQVVARIYWNNSESYEIRRMAALADDAEDAIHVVRANMMDGSQTPSRIKFNEVSMVQEGVMCMSKS